MASRVGVRMKRIATFTALAACLLGASVAAADHGRRRPRPQRPHHPSPPIDLDQLRVVTSACQDAFEGPTNEQSCIDTVMRARSRFDVPSSIRACEDAFDGDANELACLGVALDARQDPVPAIRACEDAFDGDANELTCTRTLTSSWLPTSAVRACEDAFDGDANEQACLGALVGTRYDAAQLVSYCENTYNGDADELACLGMFR